MQNSTSFLALKSWNIVLKSNCVIWSGILAKFKANCPALVIKKPFKNPKIMIYLQNKLSSLPLLFFSSLDSFGSDHWGKICVEINKYSNLTKKSCGSKLFWPVFQLPLHSILFLCYLTGFQLLLNFQPLFLSLWVWVECWNLPLKYVKFWDKLPVDIDVFLSLQPVASASSDEHDGHWNFIKNTTSNN